MMTRWPSSGSTSSTSSTSSRRTGPTTRSWATSARGTATPRSSSIPAPSPPNQHALADRFVDLDNFYDSGEVSGDGWNWSTAARAADTIEKTEPLNYAGRGLNYDYEGTNRNINVGFGTVAARQAEIPFY